MIETVNRKEIMRTKPKKKNKAISTKEQLIKPVIEEKLLPTSTETGLSNNSSLVKLAYITTVSLAMLVGVYYFLFSLQKAQAVKQADAFLKLIDNKDYTTVYNEWLSTEYKKNQTIMDFDLNQSLRTDLLGNVKNRTLQAYTDDHRISQGITRLYLYYQTVYERDQEAEEVIVLDHAYWQNNWAVDSYRTISNKGITY